MGLVKDHQIRPDTDPFVHGIVELISEDLGGPHNHGGIGILFSVTGENPAMGRPEFPNKFLIN